MTWPICFPLYSGLVRSIQVLGGFFTISELYAMDHPMVARGQIFGETCTSSR